jgi:aspartate aminotransferase-like enzyme
MNLRIPGPTPCPPDVLAASARQMIDHRGSEAAELLRRVTRHLQAIFQTTTNDVLLLTGSGTGGMEAAIVNTLSPGDAVVAVTVGAFGDRFAEIAEAYGAQVHRLAFPWGRPADPEALREALRARPETRAVLLTHNESSTGVTNDVAALAAVAREFGALTLVDSVSGLGALPLPVDAWDLDVAVTASQKAWMTPPGLTMVSVSPRAWEARERARMPRYYWDFGQAKSYAERGQTPWTPALSILYALDVALEAMLAEGLEAVFARHERVARLARDGARALGLSLLAEERWASNTVTAVAAPPGLDVRELRRRCQEEHQVVLAGGQGQLEGRCFRIGHLGWVDEAQIQAVLVALGAVLPELGFHAPPQAERVG